MNDTRLSPEEAMEALRTDYDTAVCILEALVKCHYLDERRNDDAFVCAIQALYQRRIDRGEMEAQT